MESMEIQPITYRGRTVAACTPHRVFFSEAVEVRALEDPLRRFVEDMCQYVAEVDEGDDFRAGARATRDRDATGRRSRTYVPMARTVSRPVDRVAERRRAAALAHHHRDSEQLSVAEIARRLGRAPATVKAYLYDPTGEKARAVKARYRGTCRSCGAITSPRNGKHDAHPTATAADQAPPHRNVPGNASVTHCTDGPNATAAHRPHTTGHAPTPAAAASRRCDVSKPAIGPRPRP